MAASKAFFLLARTDSSRLPGKVFLPLNGKMLIDVVIDQFSCIPEIPVVLLTSDRPIDDYLADVAMNRGCQVYRGSIKDVAGRISGAIEQTGVDAFFRVNADSPCIDFELISEAIRRFDTEQCDLVSNLVTRTYPYGVSVELINSNCYLAVEPSFTGQQREHPTSYFYHNLDKFSYSQICRADNSAEVRLTVDTLSDYIYFAELLQRVPEFLSLSTPEKLRIVDATND